MVPAPYFVPKRKASCVHDGKTCHPNASFGGASRCFVSMPGATEDIDTNLRRLIVDAVIYLDGPRGAASTEKSKVAFCRSFSVSRTRRKRAGALRACALPGADWSRRL